MSAPDYDRAKRQMFHYLDDELALGLEGELEGIVDWDWLVRAVVDAAISRSPSPSGGGGRIIFRGWRVRRRHDSTE